MQTVKVRQPLELPCISASLLGGSGEDCFSCLCSVPGSYHPELTDDQMSCILLLSVSRGYICLYLLYIPLKTWVHKYCKHNIHKNKPKSNMLHNHDIYEAAYISARTWWPSKSYICVCVWTFHSMKIAPHVVTKKNQFCIQPMASVFFSVLPLYLGM